MLLLRSPGILAEFVASPGWGSTIVRLPSSTSCLVGGGASTVSAAAIRSPLPLGYSVLASQKTPVSAGARISVSPGHGWLWRYSSAPWRCCSRAKCSSPGAFRTRTSSTRSPTPQRISRPGSDSTTAASSMRCSLVTVPCYSSGTIRFPSCHRRRSQRSGVRLRSSRWGLCCGSRRPGLPSLGRSSISSCVSDCRRQWLPRRFPSPLASNSSPPT